MRSKAQPQAAPANEDYEPEGDWLDVARYRSQMAGAQANKKHGPGAADRPAWMQKALDDGDAAEVDATMKRAMEEGRRAASQRKPKGEDLPPKE